MAKPATEALHLPGGDRPLIHAATADGDAARVWALQIRAAASSMRWALLGSILGAPLMAANVTTRAITVSEARYIWVWCALVMIAQSLALWHTARLVRVGFADGDAIAQGRRLMLWAVLAGMSWGAAPWLLLSTPFAEVNTIVIISVALVLMAGAGALAICRPLVLAFVGSLWALFVPGVMLRVEPDIPAAVAFLLLGGVMIAFARTLESAVATAMRLNLEKERLLIDLQVQQEATEGARREAEAARVQAESANMAKTAFLAAAGHDLRQPMHALVQYHGHLVRQNADTRLADTLSRIGKSLDAMQELLDSMLEVSKLLTGAVRPVLRRLQVRDLVDGLDAQVRPMAESKGLQFEVRADAAQIETDPVLLERILRNLLVNAVRYTRQGVVRLRSVRRGGRLRIQVWDTGIGIAKAEQAKVFQEFYQVGNEARHARRGLGLGLALVRQLSELLSLRLRMRSVPGKGTVFMVDVPLASSGSDGAPAASGRAPFDYVRGASITLIDDNEDSLQSTAVTLRAFGARVLTAHSGMEAIERMQELEFAPQVVLSDYRLEDGETGLDAIRMVIDSQKTLLGDDFEVMALVASGETAPDVIQRVHDAGLPIAHKPLKPRALYEALNERLAILAGRGR